MSVTVPNFSGPLPTPSDLANYEANSVRYMEEIPGVITAQNAQNAENNAINENVNAQVASIAPLLTMAEAQSAFKGSWLNHDGPMAMPACVTYPDEFLVTQYWVLARDVALVENEEPGVSTAWSLWTADANSVPYDNTASGRDAESMQGIADELASEIDTLGTTKASLAGGAAFTSPITVPAGATGEQAPQAQEVVTKAGGGTVAGSLSAYRTPLLSGTLTPETQTIDLGTVSRNAMAMSPVAGTITLTLSGGAAGDWLLLEIGYTSGSITWAGVNWATPGGTAPTIAAGKTHILFMRTGSDLFGFAVGETT